MEFTLTEDQQSIFDSMVKFTNQYQKNMILVQGFAGTGKSYLVNKFIEWFTLESDTLFQNVAVTAPTHKAVKVLKKMSLDNNLPTEKVDYSTLHSILGLRPQINDQGEQIFVKDPMLKSKFALYDLIIVDEASMIDDKLFHEMMIQNVRNSKIIFVGDSEQIPPVNEELAIPFDPEKQKEFGIEVFSLVNIIRQAEGNPIIQVSKSIREGSFERLAEGEMLAEDKEGHGVVFVRKDRNNIENVRSLLKKYFTSQEFSENPDHVKVIAWRNKIVDQFNTTIRKFIYGDNPSKIEIGEKLIADKPIIDSMGEIIANTNEDLVVQEFFVDTKMIYNIPFKYYKTRTVGDEGITKDIDILHESVEPVFNRLLVQLADKAKNLPKGAKRTNAWKNFYETKEMFAEVKYNYAITAHKCQGSTYNIAIVLNSDFNNNQKEDERRKILYTACTRPKEKLYII